MAGEMQSGLDALTMDPKDHVATALKDLKAGSTIQYRLGEDLIELELKEDIPFGHKAAIKPIAKGTDVRKYGDVIGRATEDIAVGYHVHVHNVEGIRGRGDQAKAANS